MCIGKKFGIGVPSIILNQGLNSMMVDALKGTEDVYDVICGIKSYEKLLEATSTFSMRKYLLTDLERLLSIRYGVLRSKCIE